MTLCRKGDPTEMKQSYSHSRYVPAEMEGARATASRPISILWVAALLLQEGRPGEPHPQDMLLLLRLHEALGGHTPVFCPQSLAPASTTMR